MYSFGVATQDDWTTKSLFLAGGQLTKNRNFIDLNHITSSLLYIYAPLRLNGTYMVITCKVSKIVVWVYMTNFIVLFHVLIPPCAVLGIHKNVIQCFCRYILKNCFNLKQIIFIHWSFKGSILENIYNMNIWTSNK